jgi:prepilin signal peptidase PulO-like enzyme (type II secretory pathway)
LHPSNSAWRVGCFPIVRLSGMPSANQAIRQYSCPELVASRRTLPELPYSHHATLCDRRTADRILIPGVLLAVWAFAQHAEVLRVFLLTLPGLFLGFIFSWFVPVDQLLANILPMFFRAPTAQGWSWRLLSFTDSLLGAVVGAAFIFGVGFIYLHARGVEGMGFGDVKLMAMVGAFLGVKLTVFTIFAASLLGTIFGVGMILSVWSSRTRRRMNRHHEARELARRRAWQSAKMVYRYYQMPFGVFLGSMALFALFFGERVLGWYWSLYL